MLARIRKSIEEKDQGFTLIELLVVMIIIGILAAIAIPVFLNQRKKAVDASIKSDLRTIANTMETQYTDSQSYPAGFTASAQSFSVGTDTVKVSSNNTFQVYSGANGFCIKGQNAKSNATGSTYFWYDSVNGGLQSGAPTATVPSGNGSVCA